MKCKICGYTATEFSKAELINKYNVKYFFCAHCRSVHTEDPYWLDDAYSEAIAAGDVGLVDRNIKFSKITKTLISIFFNTNGSFLDYGGGYGLSVRLMRDSGFDFYHYDKFCPNLFAKGFDASANKVNAFALLTAFEIFEHLVQPIDDIEKMLSFSKNILFSTLLLPQKVPKPESWWYYALDTGQHITLYSFDTLNFLAHKFGLHLHTNGINLHLFTEKKISKLIFYFVSKYKIALFLNLFYRKKALIEGDYKKIAGKIKG